MVHKIDTPGSINGAFSAGNPFAGISGTNVGAAWLNSVSKEHVAVVEGAGLTPSKADDSQIFQAIQLLAGAGLTGGQLARLNGAIAGGAPISGEFRRVLDVVRAASSSVESGFRMPVKGNQTYGNTLAGFTVPAGYLSHGGELHVGIRGWVKPASADTVLSIGIKHNGTFFRPSGSLGTQGYTASNPLLGDFQLLRLANSTKDDAPETHALHFRFDLTIESLGENAQHPGAWIGPGTNGKGPGNTLCFGRVRFSAHREGRGSYPWAMTGTEGGFWTSGTDYTKVGGYWWHHGVVYTCVASHTSGASTEPGVGADWQAYWTFAAIELDFDHGARVDWETEQNMKINTAFSAVDDPAEPGAWSSAAVSYSSGDRVLHGGETYVCVEAHTSSTNHEPANSIGAGDGERYWEWYGENSSDTLHIDRVSVFAHGGAEGLGALY